MQQKNKFSKLFINGKKEWTSRMDKEELFSKKNTIILLLLCFVFFAIQTTWLWQLMYPIKYEEEITKYTQQFDTDPFLVLAIIQVETRFKEDIISKKGAIGPMQIMPDTAIWIIEQGDFSPYSMEYLSKPEVNIALGSWYLSTMYKQYNQNILATIAAYNAGPGNVNKWLVEGVWDGTSDNIYQIPYGETRHYIQRVLFFYDRYQTIYEKVF